jgi:Zinc knuckle
MNRRVYAHSDQKIGYILALMKDKTAAVWRDTFLGKCQNPATGNYLFPTFANFIKKLETDFKDVDSKADALYQLKSVNQGSNSIEAHNAKFLLLVTESGLDVDDNETVLVDAYQRSLNTDILRDVWKLRPVPTTLDGWMKAAQDEDNQMKQFARFKKASPSTKSTDAPKRKPFFFRNKRKAGKTIRNADIDGQDEDTEEEEEEDDEDPDPRELDLCVFGSDKGVCFNCNELGHFSRECKKPRKPKKPFGPKPTVTKFGKFKKAAAITKDLRSLTADERELLEEMLEEEGF